MSTPIVVDEWIIHDLSGENGNEKQEETSFFLSRLLKVCDKIVILKGSPFQKKIYNFYKNSGNSFHVRGISQYFFSSFIMNAQKTIFIEEGDLKPLPVTLAKLVPVDDCYLFQTHLKVPNSFILTTDGRWSREILKQKLITVKFRDLFLKNYLK